MEMLKDLKKGQCIFSDFMDGLEMVVHCPFEEMTEAFRNTRKLEILKQKKNLRCKKLKRYTLLKCIF